MSSASDAGEGGQAARPARPRGEPAVRGRIGRRREAAPRAAGWTGGADAQIAWCMVAITGGSVLAIGAVHLPVLLAVSAVTLAAALRAMHLGRGEAEAHDEAAGPWAAPAVRLPAALTLGLAAYSVAQAIPLPAGLLAKIAPVTADIWARALHPLAEAPPSFASLSLDPGASLVEALKWATYAGAFVAAATVSARRGAAFGVAVVFVSSLTAALATVGHGLVGATKVFGLYQPQFAAAPWHIGPLLNANNLSGYLNLGAFCGVGLLLSRRPLLPRWVVGLGVATIVAVGVIAASRAGLGVLPLGAALFAVLMWRRERGHSHRERLPRPVKALLALAVGGGLSLAVLGSRAMTWLEIADKNINKIEVFGAALPMLREHLWFGVGRGAFESTFPAYRVAPGNVVFTHVESFPLQWACEWGLPVALVALGGFAWAFRPSALGVRRSAVAIGAWTGTAALLAQNLVDLALEVPAVCLATAVALGSLAGDARRRGARARGGRAASPAWGWARLAAVGGAGAGLWAAAAVWGWHDLGADREAARAALEAARTDPAARGALPRVLRAAMLRHPGEPYLPLVGAMGAWQARARDDNPMPWLQRSLERAQRNGRAHLLLAEVLAAHGAKGQALFELRLAAEDDPEVTEAAARMAARWVDRYEDLSRAVPDGAEGARMLSAMTVALSRPGAEALRLRCAREAIARDARAALARFAAADVLLGALTRDAPAGVCSGGLRATCAHEVEAHAGAIEVADHASSWPAQLRARLLLADGKASQAEELLANACTRVRDRVPCLRLRVEAALSAGVEPRTQSAAKDLMNAACTGAPPCAEVNTWLGDVMAAKKEWGKAVTAFERAVAAEPSEARWMKLGEAASEAGGHARAIEAFERVLALRGEDPALRRRIAEERGKAVDRLLER